MRFLRYALMFLFLLPGIALAQDKPTVEITLSQPTAREGDVITADVYVRNARNVGGVDVGITVDDQCLSIIDRQQGGYLPPADGGSAFSAFSELNEHDTRFAAAITNRTLNTSSDGIFYSVRLWVTCPEGVADVTISYVNISVYEDPEAQIINVLSLRLDQDAVNAINAQVTISPDAQVTTEPEATLEATSPTAATTEQPTDAATATPPATPAEVNDGQPTGVGMIALLCLTIIAIVILFVVFRMLRRLWKN